jgi:hypothetical protein
MPTGYTAKLQERDLTFPEFAMICVRAMGVCVTMREEGDNVQIPEEFTPSDHHKKALEKAQEDLSALEVMNLDDAKKIAHAEYLTKKKNEREFHKKREITYARYQLMLSKVQKWNPPTPEHGGFKKFMIDQLTESIKFDCEGFTREEYTEKTPAIWISTERCRLLKDIAYHAKEYQEELKRVAGRNLWLKQFRDSLKEDV